jgi:hypothetical protein
VSDSSLQYENGRGYRSSSARSRASINIW